MESRSTAKRIGIMGGSFDPVHIGHLVIAQDAVERMELSEVVFVPAAVPPHKQHLSLADDGHRLNMLKLAVESDIRFSVSDEELVRGGVSYTIDTVRQLKQSIPDAEWVLVVGSDTLVDLHNWYKIDELLDLCEVATFLRPGESALESIAEKVRLPDERKDKLMRNVVDMHLVEVSSSEIRMRVAEGLSVRYLVSPEVEMYIFEHGLYRG
ncbi:nicotinate-nucleotide adenylyltransferase [Pontiella sulfatireligans]|uniref:Probable nicotinate-nucleotide adenylyltransferase n=1 Tax=Pontiella sulfatireligans TaxID=2750658 RepID=A0A6C2UQT0_9BACT|nr:nicotinate-nucleotide adenylyltransferase [Pontiella sulfatireligans]VGO21356.1 putative nicotinate-nucleotide adenylyltransferase [Pontiella sulfatireligans]